MEENSQDTLKNAEDSLKVQSKKKRGRGRPKKNVEKDNEVVSKKIDVEKVKKDIDESKSSIEEIVDDSTKVDTTEDVNIKDEKSEDKVIETQPINIKDNPLYNTISKDTNNIEDFTYDRNYLYINNKKIKVDRVQHKRLTQNDESVINEILNNEK